MSRLTKAITAHMEEGQQAKTAEHSTRSVGDAPERGDRAASVLMAPESPDGQTRLPQPVDGRGIRVQG